MTIIETPVAATPEKQAEYEALMVMLAERAAATARGQGPLSDLTPEQGALIDEMMAVQAAEDNAAENDNADESTECEHPTQSHDSVEAGLQEHGFHKLKLVLEQAYAQGGLEKVVEICEHLAKSCNSQDRKIGAYVTTDWSARQLDALAGVPAY